MNRRAAVAGGVALPMAAFVLLHAGRGGLASPPLTRPGEWETWLAARDPAVAALAVVRLLALAGVWYVIAASVLGIGLRLGHAHALVRVADRVTIPALRRVLVAAAGFSLASAGSSPLAFAGAPPPAAVVVPAQPLATAAGWLDTTTTTATTTETTVPAESRPPPTLTMRLLTPSEDTRPQPAPQPPAVEEAAPAATTWHVQPGDCFWWIAETVLQEAWGRAPTDAEIVP